MEIVLASQNVHKIREFRAIFKNLTTIELFTLRDFPSYEPTKPNGSSFQENAEIKAKNASQALNRWVIGDDTGLVVPALSGAPGLTSRFFAGKEASEADNRKKLLEEMKDLNGISRSAYYECALALCSPEGDTKIVTALCEGQIVERERGSQGFSYDSLFLKHDYDKTFGEVDELVKNKISHRRKAIEKLRIFFETSTP